MEWTNEAVESAIRQWCKMAGEHSTTVQQDMRAALDAAAKVQGVKTFAEVAFADGYHDGHKDGRAQALEEAAQFAEQYSGGEFIASSIRALK